MRDQSTFSLFISKNEVLPAVIVWKDPTPVTAWNEKGLLIL